MMSLAARPMVVLLVLPIAMAAPLPTHANAPPADPAGMSPALVRPHEAGATTRRARLSRTDRARPSAEPQRIAEAKQRPARLALWLLAGLGLALGVASTGGRIPGLRARVQPGRAYGAVARG